MNLPRRRKPAKLGVREAPQIRNDAHLKWVRGHVCSILGLSCSGRIEAAHVRTGTDGGMGVKPSDCWVIPLCSAHHALQHQIGETEFEKKVLGRSMKSIAQGLWAKSPHRKKSEV